jgi:hypothetical protein
MTQYCLSLYKSIGYIVSLTVVVWLSAAPGAGHAAVPSQATVVAVNYSAWVMPKNGNVKKTVRVGDALNDGDTLEVRPGNYIQIAFDEDEENIIHIEGEAMVQISGRQAIRLDMEVGKVFALLDNLGPSGKFEVFTPHSVAAVRGTVFKIQAQDDRSLATLFDGRLNMGAMLNGRKMPGDIALKPALSTAVDQGQKVPYDPIMISENSYNEINDVIRKIGGNRQPLNYSAAIESLRREGYPVDEMMKKTSSNSDPKRSRMVGVGDSVKDIRDSDGYVATKEYDSGQILY